MSEWSKEFIQRLILGLLPSKRRSSTRRIVKTAPFPCRSTRKRAKRRRRKRFFCLFFLSTNIFISGALNSENLIFLNMKPLFCTARSSYFSINLNLFYRNKYSQMFTDEISLQSNRAWDNRKRYKLIMVRIFK